jgi:hypothetical protein
MDEFGLMGASRKLRPRPKAKLQIGNSKSENVTKLAYTVVRSSKCDLLWLQSTEKGEKQLIE